MTLVIDRYISAETWENLTSSEKTATYEKLKKIEKAQLLRDSKYQVPRIDFKAIEAPKQYVGTAFIVQSDSRPLSSLEKLNLRLDYNVNWKLPKACRDYLKLDEAKSLFSNDLKLDYFGQAFELMPLFVYYSKLVTGSHYYERLNSNDNINNDLERDLTTENGVHTSSVKSEVKRNISSNLNATEGQGIELDNRRALYREDIASACLVRYAVSRAKGFSILKSMTYSMLGGRELWNMITNRRKLETIPLDYALEVQQKHEVTDAIIAVNSLLESELPLEEKRIIAQVLSPDNYNKNNKLVWLRIDKKLGYGRGKAKRHFEKSRKMMEKELNSMFFKQLAEVTFEALVN